MTDFVTESFRNMEVKGKTYKVEAVRIEDGTMRIITTVEGEQPHVRNFAPGDTLFYTPTIRIRNV